MSSHTELLSKLEELQNNPPQDEASRKALLVALRQAEYAVERPTDVIHRLSFAPLQSSVTRAACDLNLFELVSSNAKPTITLDEIVAKTGAKLLLLRRILRYLSCFGLMKEPEVGVYAPAEGTKTMAHPGLQAGIRHNHDVLLRCFAAMPQFLREHSFDNIDNVKDCPFQMALGTKLTPFEWAVLPENAHVFQNINMWMAALRDVSPSWLDVFPSELLLADPSSDSPLLIDIGGGIGHQCHELKSRYPQIKRPVILQDLPPAIAHALPTDGVKNQVYDFFGEQPVKGATFYYIKSVLHDWPDDKVMDILKNQIPSMTGESRMLLDEIVLPDINAHWRSVEMDMALMSTLGAIERTQSQWVELLATVGLAVEKTLYYDDQMMYAIQIVRKA